MRILRRGGLVKSVRGQSGGYTLARPLSYPFFQVANSLGNSAPRFLLNLLTAAVVESCRVRLRPILMTSLATLLGMIPFLFALVITTTTGHPRISALHVRIGTALFVLLFVVACWLALGPVRDRFNAACLLIQSVGGVISWLALRAVIPYLIQGQVVFELAFGGLVLHTLIVLRAKLVAGRRRSRSGT